MKKLIYVTLAILTFMSLSGCFWQRQATVASHNLSQASDNFEIERRIVFYNGITDSYMLTIQGRCSITKDNQDNQLEVTCKTGPDNYIKDYLGISDNVTYFVEQLKAVDVNTYHYRVTFRPSTIIPYVNK